MTRERVTRDDLLRFVRRDGPLSARVVFLTIEDGSDFRSREQFEAYYGAPEAQQVWEPKPPLPDEYFGLPGEYIPKLMLAFAGADMSAWESYKTTSSTYETTATSSTTQSRRRSRTAGPSSFPMRMTSSPTST